MLDPRTLERFGPFVVVRPLGRGGMGEVFVARTPWKDDPVAAVKRLRPDVARVTTFTERFKHEAELAVRLHHPNVVGTINVGSVDGQPYVASKLILGKDTGIIADRLRERRLGAPAAVVVRLLLDTLAALAYVHGARADGKWLALVHRDVTPGNVLVGYDGVARLADFGLAKSLLTEERNLTGHGEILGTPHYLAPEIIQGDQAAPVSDIYGLGAVTYRVLTGVAPHQGTTAEVLFKALSERPRPLSELRPDLPTWFVDTVHRMLEPDRKKRPYDAALLARQLELKAKEEKLFLQHASVGRWLGQLFSEEKERELEERVEIEELDRRTFKARDEGTVVIAQVRAEERLEPPPELDLAEHESQGTELDFSDPGLQAQLSAERRKSEELVRPTSLVDSDIEGLATFASVRPDQDTAFDTDAREVTASNLGPRLPGFVGADGANVEPTGNGLVGTEEDVPEELATAVSLRGAKPPVKEFVPTVETSGDDDTHRPTRRRVGSDPPEVRPEEPPKTPHRVRASKRSDDALALESQLDRLGDAASVVPAEGPTVGVSSLGELKAESKFSLRYWVIIALSAAAAVVAGVGLGLAWAPAPAEVVQLPTATQPVRDRFAETKKRLETAKNAGKPVPAEAWVQLTEAGDALLGGDLNRATQALDRVDKAMSN